MFLRPHEDYHKHCTLFLCKIVSIVFPFWSFKLNSVAWFFAIIAQDHHLQLFQTASLHLGPFTLSRYGIFRPGVYCAPLKRRQRPCEDGTSVSDTSTAPLIFKGRVWVCCCESSVFFVRFEVSLFNLCSALLQRLWNDNWIGFPPPTLFDVLYLFVWSHQYCNSINNNSNIEQVRQQVTFNITKDLWPIIRC